MIDVDLTGIVAVLSLIVLFISLISGGLVLYCYFKKVPQLNFEFVKPPRSLQDYKNVRPARIGKSAKLKIGKREELGIWAEKRGTIPIEIGEAYICLDPWKTRVQIKPNQNVEVIPYRFSRGGREYPCGIVVKKLDPPPSTFTCAWFSVLISDPGRYEVPILVKVKLDRGVLGSLSHFCWRDEFWIKGDLLINAVE
jgi:hypothetical protein